MPMYICIVTDTDELVLGADGQFTKEGPAVSYSTHAAVDAAIKALPEDKRTDPGLCTCYHHPNTPL